MIASFLLTLVLVGAPITALILARPLWRRSALLFLPMGIAFHIATIGMLSSVIHRWVSHGTPSLLAVWGLSVVLTSIFLSCVRPRHQFLERLDRRTLFLIAALAALLIVDQLVIQAKNRWSFEPNFLFPAERTYFRGPMRTDNWRHAVLVSSLIEGNPAPFLPNTKFAYQLHWHHFAAAFASPFTGLSRNAFVSGTLLATAYLFFFCLLCAICCLRPSLGARPWWLFVIALLVGSHSEIVQILYNSFVHGAPAIEADGGSLPIITRTFSLKVTTLTAPQHSLFLIFCFLSLVARQWFGLGSLAEMTFLSLCVVASPLLCLFFMPFRLLMDIRAGLRPLVHVGTSLLLGLTLFWLTWGFPPSDLFLRGAARLEFRDSWQWARLLRLPFLWMAASGMMGALLVALPFSRYRLGTFLRSPSLMGLLLASPFFYFAFPPSELARHWAILAALLVVIALTKHIPLTPGWFRTAVVASGVALFCHAYFLFSFVGKPTQVTDMPAWREYFELNAELKARSFKGPVVAAVHDNVIPPITEVTTSFTSPSGPAVHSRTRPTQLDLLKKSHVGGILPYAKYLGYQFVVWGPFEQQEWGERARKRFIGNAAPVVSTGAIAVYPLSDALASHPGWKTTATAAQNFALADQLDQDGWHMEAISEFEQGLAQENRSPKGHFGLALALKALGDLNTAATHLETAIDLGLPRGLREPATAALSDWRTKLRARDDL